MCSGYGPSYKVRIALLALFSSLAILTVSVYRDAHRSPTSSSSSAHRFISAPAPALKTLHRIRVSAAKAADALAIDSTSANRITMGTTSATSPYSTTWFVFVLFCFLFGLISGMRLIRMYWIIL
jgi:hypothetical protein